jgi:glutathione S-transferase
MLTLYLTPGASSMARAGAMPEVLGRVSPRYLTPNVSTILMGVLSIVWYVGLTIVSTNILFDSIAALLFYWPDRFEAGLWNTGDRSRSSSHLMDVVQSTIHPARAIGDARWNEVFGIADRRLGGPNWAIGRYSIADIHLFRLYWRFVDARHPDPARFPNLAAHYDRMMLRPAVRRTCEIEAAIGYALPG